MRIAQVAPLHESVPPQEYGGTERVVSFLTDELVRLGHDVTLFACGDSVTSARLRPMSPRALRLAPRSSDPMAHHVLMLERVMRSAEEFDLIHYHIDFLHFPLSRRLAVPHLTTLHGRLDLAGLHPLYTEFCDMPVVSISNAQRTPLPQANWVGTVHHGLPPDLFAPSVETGRYLAFVGRISPEKRVDRAIEIARRVGMPLVVAAKIDRADEAYFHAVVEPLFAAPFVAYRGELGDAEKGALLRGAAALLFPIDWPEPFGLVMIEAMACGTPVIAWREGSVPEVITNGVNGFIVESIDDAVAATRRVRALNRLRVRQTFDARFTADRMAQDYLALYAAVAGQSEFAAALHF